MLGDDEDNGANGKPEHQENALWAGAHVTVKMVDVNLHMISNSARAGIFIVMQALPRTADSKSVSGSDVVKVSLKPCV